MKVFAVIRIRGTVKAKERPIDTLKFLRLNRKMHCVVIPETKDYKGMLQAAKDYITWGEVSAEVLAKLIGKRGRKSGNKRLTKEEAGSIAKVLLDGKKIKSTGIKPVFRLGPPKKGFKHSIKQHYPRGELGYRGEKINQLLERMI
jgi:large subunit ribosomal protein L30